MPFLVEGEDGVVGRAETRPRSESDASCVALPAGDEPSGGDMEELADGSGGNRVELFGSHALTHASATSALT